MEKKKIIIVGAGFAGIHLARKLEEDLFDILLIDKLNYHQFQPLFYQVATSQIEPSNISFPLRNIFRKKQHIQIRFAEVKKIEPQHNRVYTNIGLFEYDYLIIATGCQTNYFGNEDIKKYTFPLKSTTDAIDIRNQILRTFENIISADEHDKESLFNLIIVGAGATGVELAGAFAEIKKFVLPRDYTNIDFTRFNIYLIEGSKNTLNSMSDQSKAASFNYLTKMGVIVKTECFVQSYNGETIELSTGEVIKSKNVIWAAGIIGNFPEGLEQAQIGRGHRLMVDRQNLVLNYRNIYAVGDVALMKTPKYPDGHPQLANVAITQATTLVKNLSKLCHGKKLIDYEFRDLGTLATIGRNKAVVDFRYAHFKGFFAWCIWMFLHLMFILSVKNKLIIFINWAWLYIFQDSSLRLILKEEEKHR